MDCANYQDGLAFRFKNQKGTALSLRRVTLHDGVPRLGWATVRKGYNLTEEDAAVCCKLAQDHKRPEFYFCRFLPGHPFRVLGRHYMSYRPTFLDNTSVGECWARADKDMKALHVGAVMDDNMQNATELKDLLSHDNFPRETENGSVLLTCENVEVKETENELAFIGEPELKITDKGSVAYTKYINENFPELPSFQQLRETLKMMLVMEWLRDKGVKISEEWMNQQLNKPKKEPKPIKVDLSPQQKNSILRDLEEQARAILPELPSALKLELPAEDAVSKTDMVEIAGSEVDCSESGVKFSIIFKEPEPFFRRFCDLSIPLLTTFELRVSLDDFDFLFEGLDPNMPAIAKMEEGSDEIQLVSPGVKSWNELFAKLTMPFPCKMVETDSKERAVFTGGCATSTIPVTKSTRPYQLPKETASYEASTRRKVYKPVPVSSKTANSTKQTSCTAVKKAAPTPVRKPTNTGLGWTDNTSHHVTDSSGKIKQQASLYSNMRVTQAIAGQTVRELRVYGVNRVESDEGPSEPETVPVHMDTDGKLKVTIEGQKVPLLEIKHCEGQRATQLVDGKEVGSPLDMSKHLTRDGKKTKDRQRDSGYHSRSSTPSRQS